MAKNEKTPTKYDQAVARARGDEETALVPTTIEEISAQQLAAGIQSISVDRIKELMAEGYEAAPQLMALEAGQMIEGTLDSEGTTDMEDPKTGEVRTIRTWQLTLTSGARVSILGSAQLDRGLPRFLGRRVVIARGGDRKTRKGLNLTEYFIAGAPERRPAAPQAEDLLGAP